jgi:hypothetical protein
VQLVIPGDDIPRPCRRAHGAGCLIPSCRSNANDLPRSKQEARARLLGARVRLSGFLRLRPNRQLPEADRRLDDGGCGARRGTHAPAALNCRSPEPRSGRYECAVRCNGRRQAPAARAVSNSLVYPQDSWSGFGPLRRKSSFDWSIPWPVEGDVREDPTIAQCLSGILHYKRA